MQFELLTGWLRYIRIGDHEIVRAIYAAVRDENWRTVPPQVSQIKQEISKDSFRLEFDVECRQGQIDYFWHGKIKGESNGAIHYSFAGESRSTFQRNRIGICVLHPITECAGRPCMVTHSDGKEEAGSFPKSIWPSQPFFDVRRISYLVAGAKAHIAFDGDEFEMEDQRNWSDASFKTYCTPQNRPKPIIVEKGDKVVQSVGLSLEQPVPTVLPVVLGRPPQFSISTTPVVLLPPIGFCVERSGQDLTDSEVGRLRVLRPAHLRVDLRLSSREYPRLLESAVRQAQSLEAPLHAALILGSDAEGELAELTTHLDRLKPLVSLWLIFRENEESADEHWVRLARQAVREHEALFAAGTLQFFTELNCHRPPPGATAFPCFSLNPQVHAFDNATMVENLAGQAMNVESAREFSTKPVVISPITLKIRSDNSPIPANELPADVDVRQISLFGGGWTLGSIARLAATGNVHSLTYFETVGWRGLMESQAGSRQRERFPSIPGTVFPLYHVFADIAEFGGKQIYPTHSSHPLITGGLTLCDPKGRRRILVANFSSEAQEIKIKTGTCKGTVRYLDSTNIQRAMAEPESFRREIGHSCESVGGKLQVNLLPCALARVDVA